MVFRTEDDSSRRLDGIEEREAIAVLVKVGHNLQGSEGACHVDDNPEAEEVARPFEANQREQRFHRQSQGSHGACVQHPVGHEACAVAKFPVHRNAESQIYQREPQ